MTLSVFALTLAAVARITDLVTRDRIFSRVRAAAIARFGEDRSLGYLIRCRICVSVWVGFAVAPLAWHYGHTGWFVVPAVALAVSWLYITIAEELDPA